MISRAWAAFVNWLDRYWLEFFGLGAVTLLLLIVLWPLIFYTVPPGHVGVMWYRFFGGTVTDPDRVLDEGLHVILPWDRIYIYNARLQRMDETVTGLSVDGLHISANVATRFVIEKRYAGYLHQALGPDFTETLMRPQLRTLVLTFISENGSADLYSTRRSQIQNIIEAQFQAALAGISTNVAFRESYVKLEDVLIEEIRLPAFVERAIEEKEKVRHMSEAYEYRIQLEEKERQRKRIEAEGIRSFQEIVAPGITDSYLRWRGIEATLQLAQSNNAKVVIIGNSADGLPIILNTDSFQGVPEETSTPPDGDVSVGDVGILGGVGSPGIDGSTATEGPTPNPSPPGGATSETLQAPIGPSVGPFRKPGPVIPGVTDDMYVPSEGATPDRSGDQPALFSAPSFLSNFTRTRQVPVPPDELPVKPDTERRPFQ